MVIGAVGFPDPTSPAGTADSSTSGGGFAESDNSGDGSVSVAPNSYVFDITGDATTVLVPGTEAVLDLLLTNDGEVDLVIVELLVEIADIDAPFATNALPCSTADFTVRQLKATDIVHSLPAGSEHTLKGLGLSPSSWPAVLMLNRPVNQDGCQDATLTLHYTGIGTATDT
jgi:hypothetical protein